MIGVAISARQRTTWNVFGRRTGPTCWGHVSSIANFNSSCIPSQFVAPIRRAPPQFVVCPSQFAARTPPNSSSQFVVRTLQLRPRSSSCALSQFVNPIRRAQPMSSNSSRAPSQFVIPIHRAHPPASLSQFVVPKSSSRFITPPTHPTLPPHPSTYQSTSPNHHHKNHPFIFLIAFYFCKGEPFFCREYSL